MKLAELIAKMSPKERKVYEKELQGDKSKAEVERRLQDGSYNY